MRRARFRLHASTQSAIIARALATANYDFRPMRIRAMRGICKPSRSTVIRQIQFALFPTANGKNRRVGSACKGDVLRRSDCRLLFHIVRPRFAEKNKIFMFSNVSEPFNFGDRESFGIARSVDRRTPPFITKRHAFLDAKNADKNTDNAATALCWAARLAQSRRRASCIDPHGPKAAFVDLGNDDVRCVQTDVGPKAVVSAISSILTVDGASNPITRH